MTDNEATQAIGGGQQPKKSANGSGLNKAAYAGGGFAAGVASTLAGTALAADKPADVPAEADPKEQGTEVPVEVEAEPKEGTVTPAEEAAIDPAKSPAEQDVIIATDEGIRVAQVDDDKSFAEAFADARAQVGAGGVFEWHGKVYGTYYKEEWDNMSGKERAEWQASIDYNDVRDEQEALHYAHHDATTTTETDVEHHVHHVNHVVHHYHTIDDSQPKPTLMASSEPQMHTEEVPSANPEDSEIRILGVETVEGPDGDAMTIAGLEAPDGDQALIVDIDNNGQFDVLLHDDNYNGELETNEIHDISELGATVEDLNQAFTEQENMLYTDNADDVSGFTGDPDMSTLV